MSERRHYRLLCPIARALDVVGDRWTLLILRDLHAGPARFQELQEGLGIATNLLSTRLKGLAVAGLIERSDQTRSASYQLTEAGRGTDRILWELVRFGAGIERDADPREPGNLRTVALPLRILLQSVPDRPNLCARLVIDDAEFTIISTPDSVEVQWGRTTEIVDVVARTSYHTFLDVGEGLMGIDEFAANHLEFVAGEENKSVFLALLGAAMMTAG
ncbi:MAG: winged helix-turn-helix transcriptional regulator [Acidimicrobiales bacterium]